MRTVWEVIWDKVLGLVLKAEVGASVLSFTTSVSWQVIPAFGNSVSSSVKWEEGSSEPTMTQISNNTPAPSWRCLLCEPHLFSPLPQLPARALFGSHRQESGRPGLEGSL